jgi:diguanylate cyclase (GGDEF)-like protein
MDLDRFKVVNDTWGHSVGSSLLASVGKLLKDAIRETDRPIRYGGDVFVIVMPETDREGALVMAQRIREGMPKALPAEYAKTFTLSASIGVSVYPGDGTTAQELLDAADRAMYAAKARGRNGVVWAGEMTK